MRIVQGYGLSEVTNFSCVMPSEIDDAEYRRWMLEGRRASIGPALPGQEVEIMNGETLAKPGEEGELVIRGHCVMSGYLHNEQATDEVFRGGWFHTGDLGYFLPGPDGRKFMHVSGRIRDIAKRSGAMVNLLEIDQVLAAIPGVADAAATAFPNKWVDEEIGALVVRAKDCALDSDSILEHCRHLLPFAETPKAIVFVDEVPRTVTGKVRRREMVDWFATLENQLFTERRRA
jgi:long-chain acyl-CoA synthetase